MPQATAFRLIPAAKVMNSLVPGAVAVTIDGEDRFYPETASLYGIARELEQAGIGCSQLKRAIDDFVIAGIFGSAATKQAKAA